MHAKMIMQMHNKMDAASNEANTRLMNKPHQQEANNNSKLSLKDKEPQPTPFFLY